MITLDELLQKYGLPRAMTARVDDKSHWMVPFEIEATQICESFTAIPKVQFTFVEGTKMQAVAIQDEFDAVVMYAGMFWMLCRLAAAAVGSGVFPAMEGDAEPKWAPDLTRSLKSPRKLLEETKPFDWELESAGWNSEPERVMLFYTVLSILFRFVMFHEIGHLQNDHGRRRLTSSSPPMLIDTPGLSCP